MVYCYWAVSSTLGECKMKTFSAEVCILNLIKTVSIDAIDIQEARKKLQEKYSKKFPNHTVSIRYVKELV